MTPHSLGMQTGRICGLKGFSLFAPFFIKSKHINLYFILYLIPIYCSIWADQDKSKFFLQIFLLIKELDFFFLAIEIYSEQIIFFYISRVQSHSGRIGAGRTTNSDPFATLLLTRDARASDPLVLRFSHVSQTDGGSRRVGGQRSRQGSLTSAGA